MFRSLGEARRQYPHQFWLLFWGMLINAAGTSMIWPFLTIFLRQQLGVSLTTVAGLMTLNAVMTLLSSFIAGPFADRFGRKGVMVLSLTAGSVGYVLMSQAHTLPAFAALMALNGLISPLYRVGADAMVADLIPPEKRLDAYSLLRMINNAGVAIGPSVGGFVAVASYTVAFYVAASCMGIYAFLVIFFIAETLSRLPTPRQEGETAGMGYGTVFKDRLFLSFCGCLAMITMSIAMMFILLSVYTKKNYGIPENQYGFIMANNAVMVVFVQYFVTQITRNRPRFWVLAVGALLYSLGVGSVALGRGFFGFLASMVVVTFGELVTVPTATTLTANLAPPDMRGRYMSIYGLTWGIGTGIGPVIGGLLNDLIAPVAIWYGGLAIGLVGFLGFVILARRNPAVASRLPEAAG